MMFVVHVGVECIQCNKSMLITEVLGDKVITCPDRDCGSFGRLYQLPKINLRPWPETSPLVKLPPGA